MAIIPTVRCRHMKESIDFYTNVLDFVCIDGGGDDGRSGGLKTPGNPQAPEAVHEGPIDQTWGTREFYVDDPDGNTLRFTQTLP